MGTSLTRTEGLLAGGWREVGERFGGGDGGRFRNCRESRGRSLWLWQQQDLQQRLWQRLCLQL